MEKCHIDIYTELLLLPKYDNSGPSVTWDKEICHMIMSWCHHYCLKRSTHSRMFTCCPNLMILASLWLEIHRFSNWSFCYFEQLKVDIHFANIWQARIDPICFLLLTLDRLQLKMLQVAGREKQSNENSITMHKIWHKLFLMIQSAGIKNCCLPPTNML